MNSLRPKYAPSSSAVDGLTISLLPCARAPDPRSSSEGVLIASRQPVLQLQDAILAPTSWGPAPVAAAGDEG